MTGTAVVSDAPTLAWTSVSSAAVEWPFHFFTSSLLRAERFLDCQRVLYFTACFSRWSRAWLTAMDISLAWARPTSGPLRGLMVISALWRCFSTARMTLVSNLSPKILRIFARPVSTSLRMAGVISYCLPVYSTFIEHPPGIRTSTIWAQTTVRAGVANLPAEFAGKLPAGRRRYFLTLRWWVLGMRMSSRYFATVRRVTWIPCD